MSDIDLQQPKPRHSTTSSARGSRQGFIDQLEDDGSDLFGSTSGHTRRTLQTPSEYSSTSTNRRHHHHHSNGPELVAGAASSASSSAAWPRSNSSSGHPHVSRVTPFDDVIGGRGKRSSNVTAPPPSYSTRQLAPSSSNSAYHNTNTSTSSPRIVSRPAGATTPFDSPGPTTTSSSARFKVGPNTGASVLPHTSPWPAHLTPGRQQASQLSSVSGPGSIAAKSHRSTVSRRIRNNKDHVDSASESGVSLISNFHPNSRSKNAHVSRSSDLARQQKRALLAQTDSPLRRWTKSFEPAIGSTRAIVVAVIFVVVIKYVVGLGGYSGFGVPPLRGDLEAQRHWLSLTSSFLDKPWLHLASSSYANHLKLPLHEWYHHDYDYWRLDYPPLTAYHSLLLGFLARLAPRSAEYVTWRPPSGADSKLLAVWEENMVQLEETGDMKAWMRTSVIVGDLLIYVSAVVVYCSRNYAKEESSSRRAQPVIVTTLSILLQPALILIDNGHFQYNSLMLGFTLWTLNFLQAGHDLLAAIAFVCALGFKQMALYYSPAIFAYLLGKCFYRGGREGLSLFINLGFVTLGAFALLLSPFLWKPSEILQVFSRIFPFSRGLFEDKVANFWCAINVVIKLRQIASVSSLARLSLLFTLLAILPSVLGLLWISHELGRRNQKSEARVEKLNNAASTTQVAEVAEGGTPAFKLLPHALFITAMSFFMFSFQVHEKSILLPLMPLTVLMGAREAGYGRMDWEWGVLLNNVGVFSMWPLLKRDGVGPAYFVLTLGWNYAIGYNPFILRRSFVKYLSLVSYALIILLHTVESVASPPAHLPDLFVVMNLTMSCGVFALGYLWASKRFVQEAWAVVGMK